MRRKLVLALGLVMMLTMAFVGTVLAAEGENEWVLTDIELPVATYGSVTVMAEDDLYYIGGYNGSASVNTVYAYQNGTWTEKNPLPTAVHAMSATYFNGKIYVFGGFAGNPQNGLQIYDISNNSWTLKALPYGYSITDIALTFVGDKIYLAGGRGYAGAGVNLFYEYDPVSDEFTQMPDLIVAAGGNNGKLIYYNDELYFFGGWAGFASTFYAYNACQKFNFDKNQWEMFTQAPSIIAGSAIAQVGADVYIIGGLDASCQSDNKVYKYSLAADTWTLIASLPTENFYPYAEVIDSKIYLFGGANNRSSEYYNTVYTYTLSDTPPIIDPADTRLYVLLDIAEQAQLSVTHNLADNANLTWTSTDPAVATADAAGRVTAIAEGTCLIYARNSDGSFVDYIPVKVLAGGADEYRLALHLNAGESKRLWITDDYANVTWSSMDPATATVDSAGRVTGVAQGLCLVQGEYEGQVYTIYVRVNQ